VFAASPGKPARVPKALAVPAQILDGRVLAAELRTELIARASALREGGLHPRLVIEFIGHNESSVAYVRNLVKTGEKIGIDVGVLDFLSGVLQTVGENKATILSAYRTPETNAMLAKKGFKAAENSQHLYGRALDIHMSDKLAEAMKTARAMQRGGVGWYPHSNFMHIDTGPVRNWDLDHKERGTLLVGNHKVHFDKKGNLQVAKGKSTVDAKSPAVLRGEGPLSVRDRLARLRKLARAEYVARH